MAGTPNGTVAEPVQGQGQPPVTNTPSASAAPASAQWYDSAEPELKGFAELKGFKSPLDALKYGRDTERFVGVPKDEIVRVPKDLASAKPEELDALYGRLGRPAAPADYKLPVVEGGEEFAGAMAPVLHKAGVSQAQATTIAEGYTEFMKGAVEAQERAQAQQEQIDLASLKREWPGETFTQREEMARRAVSQFVMPSVGGDRGKAEEILGKIEDAVGTATFLRLFSNIGEKVGESSFVDGSQRSNSSFGMTPAAAREQLAMKRQDRDWSSKALNNPGGPERQEWDRLIQIGSQGR
jgi:hypothetical protein